jgi:uncharacterized protein (DUF4415 family)
MTATRPTRYPTNTTGARRTGRLLPDADFIPVERREDIPVFTSEDEEAESWATHGIAGALLEEMQPVPRDGDAELPPARSTSVTPRTRPISVRLDGDVLRRLKVLATKKGKGYQSLLKEFVVERLYEEEKREGIVG